MFHPHTSHSHTSHSHTSHSHPPLILTLTPLTLTFITLTAPTLLILTLRPLSLILTLNYWELLATRALDAKSRTNQKSTTFGWKKLKRWDAEKMSNKRMSRHRPYRRRSCDVWRLRQEL